MKRLFPFVLLFISLTIKSQEIKLDTDYGVDGYTSFETLTHDTDLSYSKLLDDGSILMSARTFDEVNGTQNILIKYNSEGVMDTSFANNGFYTFDFTDDGGAKFFVDHNNDIYIVYNHLPSEGDTTYNNSGILKLDSNGVLNTVFQQNISLLVLEDYDNIEDAYLHDDGFYILLSKYDTLLMQRVSEIKKINSDGSFDETFGNEGSIKLQNPAYQLYATKNNEFLTLEIPENTTLSFEQATIVKYNNDGSLDEDYGDNGALISFNNGIIHCYHSSCSKFDSFIFAITIFCSN